MEGWGSRPSQPGGEGVSGQWLCRWIHLEQFLSYAPELNPVEGIWNYLKRLELKNRCCQRISTCTTNCDAKLKNVCDTRSVSF
jgi:hypothetical protein